MAKDLAGGPGRRREQQAERETVVSSDAGPLMARSAEDRLSECLVSCVFGGFIVTFERGSWNSRQDKCKHSHWFPAKAKASIRTGWYAAAARLQPQKYLIEGEMEAHQLGVPAASKPSASKPYGQSVHMESVTGHEHPMGYWHQSGALKSGSGSRACMTRFLTLIQTESGCLWTKHSARADIGPSTCFAQPQARAPLLAAPGTCAKELRVIVNAGLRKSVPTPIYKTMKNCKDRPLGQDGTRNERTVRSETCNTMRRTCSENSG